jgi:hypothetical protein
MVSLLNPHNAPSSFGGAANNSQTADARMIFSVV